MLTEELPGVLTKLAFPRSMRWQTEAAFSRPVRWLLALHGEQVRTAPDPTGCTRPLGREMIQGSQSRLNMALRDLRIQLSHLTGLTQGDFGRLMPTNGNT